MSMASTSTSFLLIPLAIQDSMMTNIALQSGMGPQEEASHGSWRGLQMGKFMGVWTSIILNRNQKWLRFINENG